jgi:hypothetical protein
VATHLAQLLKADPDSLVGRHYTCLVEADRFGVTRSDFRLKRV